MSTAELQARTPHPLLSLVAGSDVHEVVEITKLAHTCPITALAQYVAGGRHIVISADEDGRVKLWALTLAPAPALLPVGNHLLHSSAVRSMECRASSDLLVTASDDGHVRLWHLPALLRCPPGQHQSAQKACLAHQTSVLSASLSHCGGFVACSCSGRSVVLWSAEGGAPLAELPLRATSACFLPGNAAALLVVAEASIAWRAGEPVLLDLRVVPECRQYCAAVHASGSGAGSEPYPGARGVRVLSHLPRGIVTALYEGRGDGGGTEWDADKRSFVHQQGGHTRPVHTLLALPSALHVLTFAKRQECKLWPIWGGGGSACCTLLPGSLPAEPRALTTRPVLSSDGRFLLLGRSCGSIVCWDVQQAQRAAHVPVSRKRGNPAAIGRWLNRFLTALSLAPDCTVLVAGDAEGRLLLRCR